MERKKDSFIKKDEEPSFVVAAVSLVYVAVNWGVGCLKVQAIVE